MQGMSCDCLGPDRGSWLAVENKSDEEPSNRNITGLNDGLVYFGCLKTMPEG